MAMHVVLFLIFFTFGYAESRSSNFIHLNDHVPQNTSIDGGVWNTRVVVMVGLAGGVFALFLITCLLCAVCACKRKHSTSVAPLTHSDNHHVKITIDGDAGGLSEILNSHIHEGNIVIIPIQDLKKATNNFSQVNIIGRGGSGTVYKGELHDRTKVAVKRTELNHKGAGVDEFKSEVAILTKVRHRHVVALRGCCFDANERVLVYEHMPQGTLSKFLFDWKQKGVKPLECTQRLIIALDVARGVEYLHCLAQQSFIHRDLKPCNILLGDDMRAKVADFGLARPVPHGEDSLVTQLAGTFGYMAHEYAEMGQVSIKTDVYSFGVILMQLITGRRAIDTKKQDESVPLVKWFRGMYNDEVTFREAIEPTLDLDEEALACASIMAELANHCCASKPEKTPNMSYVVNELLYLVEPWNPSEQEPDPEGVDHIDINSDNTGSFTSLDER